MRLWKTVLPAITLILSFNVKSATLIDTGPGPDPWPGNAWGFSGNSKFAGQFTLAESTSINSITGWFGVDGFGTGLDLNIVIYDDTSGLPGQQLYASSVYVPPPTGLTLQNPYNYEWYGAFDLDWVLLAGDYWVSFEGANELQSTAIMPGPSQNPLIHYASNDAISNYQWRFADYLDLGVRIEGSPSIVPVPAAALLFGSGLIGLIGFARHKSRI